MQLKRYFKILTVLTLYLSNTYAQSIYQGKVVDLQSNIPVDSVKVFVNSSSDYTLTNYNGEFGINVIQLDDAVLNITIPKLTFTGKSLHWDQISNVAAKLYSLNGQEIGGIYNRYSYVFPQLADGIYIFRLDFNYITGISKIHSMNNTIYLDLNQFTFEQNLNLNFIKDGYYLLSTKLKTGLNENYQLKKLDNNDIPYLNYLTGMTSFNLLKGDPLNDIHSEVKAVKFLYDKNTQEIYYMNMKINESHYDFAYNVLGFPNSSYSFYNRQFTDGPGRQYYSGSLNLYRSSGYFTIDFFAGYDISCESLSEVYNRVINTVHLQGDIYFHANNLNWEKCVSVPSINTEELLQGQNYQPLNLEESYGYLKKIDFKTIDTEYISYHDVVIINGIPNNIPIVSGIITADFQTPLSHINVLSKNRGTPNMALRDAWNNKALENFMEKLVYFNVGIDSFIIKEASLQEAQEFWAQNEPAQTIYLPIDTSYSDILDISEVDFSMVSTVGGKCANMGEMEEIDNNLTVPIPEHAFCIPFYYYHDHMVKNGLDTYVNNMLQDDLFQTDIQVKRKYLDDLQDSIIQSPIDPDLLSSVNTMIRQNGNFEYFRFRSSTNAEDIEGFNGAGLYDSYSGSLNDPKKPIDMAIKRVWASLWNYRAFEERYYFKIVCKSIAMGVLAHRSFPNEQANGVLITKNLYNNSLPGFTVNVQFGEISIVRPESGYTPEQFIYYTFDDNLNSKIEYISHSSVPGMGGNTILSDDEIEYLITICQNIHQHYKFKLWKTNPLDIEFKVDLVANQRKLYIKQVRFYNDL